MAARGSEILPLYSSMKIIIRTVQVKPEFFLDSFPHLRCLKQNRTKEKEKSNHNHPKKQLPASVLCLLSGLVLHFLEKICDPANLPAQNKGWAFRGVA